MTLTLERLAEIEQAVAKATPGPYYVAADDAADTVDHAGSGLSLVDTGRHGDWPIARLCETNNADLIALCDPATVASLCDAFRERDRLKADLAAARALLREARDNAYASIAEIRISQMRYEYRKKLVARIDAALAGEKK